MTAAAVLMLLAAALMCWPGHVPAVAARRGRPTLRAAVGVTGGRPLVPLAAIIVGGAGMAVSGSITVGLAAALTAGTASHTIVLGHRRRAAARAELRMLQAVRALAREFRAGASPGAALAAVGSGSDGSPMIGRLSRAVQVDPAAGTSATVPDGTEGALAAALRLAGSAGIPVADLVGRLGDDVDERIRRDRQRTSVVAGARLSGHLLTALPVLGVLLGAGIGADPLPVLFGGGAGSALLLTGVLLCCAGVLWAARIAR